MGFSVIRFPDIVTIIARTFDSVTATSAGKTHRRLFYRSRIEPPGVSSLLKKLSFTLAFTALIRVDGGLKVWAQSIDEFTQQAHQLTQDYRWREAIRLLEKAVRKYPDEPQLLVRLGNLFVRSGQASEGERWLQQALFLHPDNPRTLYLLGKARLRRGNVASAIDFFQQSLRCQPNQAETHHRLAFAFNLQGKKQQALEHAKHAVQLEPREPRYRCLYSSLLNEQGQRKESFQELRMAYRLTPQDPRLLFQLGDKRRLAGELTQALEYLELASAQDRENPLYHSELSRLYQQLGQKEKALQEAERARDLRQAFRHYTEALTLVTKGEQSKAFRRLEPVVQAHPEFVTGMMLLAQLYRKMGLEKKALDLYLKILEQDPFQSAAREEGAWIEAEQGSITSALQLLRKSHRESPNQALIEGYREILEENWDKALEHLRRAEVKNPLDAGLLQLISLCLNGQGRNKAALAYLEKAEKLQPGDANIRGQIRQIEIEDAFRLLDEKKWDASLQAFLELNEEQGPSAEYLLITGYCRQQLGDLAGAVSNYQDGLKEKPEATWARMNLVSCLHRLSRYQEAADEWLRIIARSETPEAYFQLGLCYSYLSLFRKAEDAFEKALRLGADRPEVSYNLRVIRLYRRMFEGPSSRFSSRP